MPFRIGIAPAAVASGGGIYQYSQVMMSVLAELRRTRDDEIVAVGDGLTASSPVLGGDQWQIVPLTPRTSGRRLRHTLHRLQARFAPAARDAILGARARFRPRGLPPAEPTRRADVHRWLTSQEIGLMIYPAPAPLAFEAGIPYVLAVHDLQHRIHPEFPEVSADGELSWREYVFRNGIGEALVVLVDSETGKEDVLAFYGDRIHADRVAVLPFLPATPTVVTDADRARVRSRYALPDRYLFYPAQFWPHKNHRRVIEALGSLRRDGVEPQLVVAGSSGGALRSATYADVVATARKLGVEAALHTLGYAPEEDMAALYAEAEALVMPTFFGPTNIPILEAWGLGCPVITSDIRGVRDQAGDAALLVDPSSATDIARAIRCIWTDSELRADLAARGRARLAGYTRADYTRRLSAVLDQAKELAA